MTTRVLIVDDAIFMRTMLRNIFVESGFEVIGEAGNGNDAVEKYRALMPDLTTLDIVMPEKEGIETIQELRQKSASVKIIAISGGGRISPEEYLDWAKRFGVHRTFTKPIDRDELLRTVAELTGTPIV